MKQSFKHRKVAPIGSAAFFSVLICLLLIEPGRSQTSGTAIRVQTPRTLSYQGSIMNGEKPVADGIHPVTVTIYADENGSSSLWTSSYAPRTSGGVFSVLLGSDKPLPDAKMMDRPLWVGVRVDNGQEMRPLTQLSASAYAMNVADNAITTTKLADGAVTDSKFGTEYVGSISVNGQKVTSKGGNVNFIAGDGLSMAFDPGSGNVLVQPSASGARSGKGADVQSPVAGFKFWGEGLNDMKLGTEIFGTTNWNGLGGGTDDLEIYSENTEAMRILGNTGPTNHWIGVGTTTPAVEFDVAAGAMHAGRALGGWPAMEAVKGEINQDNIDLAWAQVPASAIPALILACDMTSYNTLDAQWVVPGVCKVHIFLPPGGFTPTAPPCSPARPVIPLGQCAVIANVVEDCNGFYDPNPPFGFIGNTPGFATVSMGGLTMAPPVCPFLVPLAMDEFYVKTYTIVGGAMVLTSLPFTFRVVGR